ncbi:MAG: hypothetical protein KME48_07115 [Candidatus Thiodiazotropha sp. (ex Ctena orbiculata)]|nr:hypothetical protein [Candidatus Thiodiazotropha taylori]MBT3034556.1 hypothetical protein [Candidatus Thiodiazotropha taylori]
MPLTPHVNDPNYKSERKRYKDYLKNPKDRSFGWKTVNKPDDWKPTGLVEGKSIEAQNTVIIRQILHEMGWQLNKANQERAQRILPFVLEWKLPIKEVIAKMREKGYFTFADFK